MEEKLLENHKRYLERINFYKKFGYNIEEERKFILERSHPISGDILEVGTGKGYFTVELAKEGHRFTSIDISDQEQEFARLNVKYFGLDKFVDFRIEDAGQLSFGDSSFDVIFSINTIHHFTSPTQVIDELIRVLSPEGKIILSDFNNEGLKAIDRIHAEEGRIHETGRSNLSDISSYFENRGFRVKKHKRSFQDLIIAYHLCP